MADPQIVGWAHSKFGKSQAADTMELMAEVVGPALAHAGVGTEDVDGIFVGNYNNGFQRQDFQGALVAMAGLVLPADAATTLQTDFNNMFPLVRWKWRHPPPPHYSSAPQSSARPGAMRQT